MLGYHGDQAHGSTKVVNNGATVKDHLADFGSQVVPVLDWTKQSISPNDPVV